MTKKRDCRKCPGAGRLYVRVRLRDGTPTACQVRVCEDCGNEWRVGWLSPGFARARYDEHGVHIRRWQYAAEEPTFPMTDLITDEDTPDGVYFALAHELGEL